MTYRSSDARPGPAGTSLSLVGIVHASRDDRSFNASSRATLLVTAGMGIVVAWAPAVPHGLRFPLIFLALVAWLCSVTLTALRGAIAAKQLAECGLWQDRIWATLGIGGIGMAVLCAVQLELVRLLWDRPDLSWNVDWRWAWSQAQGIARFGSLDRALDYAAGPVEYHVGPAWLAAAAQRILGLDLTHVLFGAVPALSTLSTLIAVIWLLACCGFPRRVAAAAAGLAACLPAALSPFLLDRLYQGPAALVLDADTWMFATFMLNQHLGLAVGMASLVLLLDRGSRTISIVISALGLASLIQIKPQFFISFGFVAGVLAIARLAASTPFAPRSLLVLAGCAVALIAAAGGVFILPRYPSIFEIRDVGLASLSKSHAYYFAGIELLFVPLFLVLLVALVRPAWSAAMGRTRLELLTEPMVATLLAAIVLAALLEVLRLPLVDQVVAKAEAVGIPGSLVAADATFALTPMMFPLRLLLVSAVAAWLSCTVLTRLRGPSTAIASALIGAAIILSPVPHLARGFAQPLLGYEAAEEPDLRDLLRSVPRDGSLLVSSDLADPADGTSRRLRGFLLTAYEGHEFHVANIVYLNYLREDAAGRLRNLRAFFGAPWTNWHGRWLKESGITHVLVHERCLPEWWPQREQVLSLVASRGRWSLFAPRSHDSGVTGEPRPPATSLRPRYGEAHCLE